ncbi:MAG: 16S rRNA (cytosine(1402)-N(4))-methyltransferase RsmH [Spirochaetia bacterium]|jgi:16S rRNA (cytosine1402-N4)-methyltransferase|nr:16S rRNA (cytosine(1402)-N(4))-methyltransferase RsmH [Spirochaetia bacterium]
MEYVHYPVMKKEVFSLLIPPRDRLAYMVDCTCGEGGHTQMMLDAYDQLTVFGLDCDVEIQKKAICRMQPYGNRFVPVHTWFDDFFKQYHGPLLDLVLFDLGISSFHYEESERGFSFKAHEALDMRLDKSLPMSAADLVNTLDEDSLADLIYQYGEERYSRRFARAIVEQRAKQPFVTSDELEQVIFQSAPRGYRYGRIHPATRTFQALRIAVNKELDRIGPAIRMAVDALQPGGRLAVISFHSLEDRIVKWSFRELAGQTDSTVEPRVKILTKKPLVPDDEETELNPPSRSAKLRVIEKLRVTGKTDPEGGQE